MDCTDQNFGVAHFEIRSAQNPGASSLGRLYIYGGAVYFRHNFCSFYVYLKMCLSSLAPSRKRQIVEFFHVTPELWVRSVERNVPRITFLAPTIGRWFLDFWKICGPLLKAPCYIDENRSFVCIVRISTCSRLRFAIIVMQWCVSS